MIRTAIAASLILFFPAFVLAQLKPKTNSNSAADADLRSTPAYAEILLRQTELTAEVESLLGDFTEEFPKVKDLKMELELLKAESSRMLALKPADSGKLTLALGKLVLGKVSHAAALKRLQAQYQDGHPSVKKAKRMVEIYEAAIREILG